MALKGNRLFMDGSMCLLWPHHYYCPGRYMTDVRRLALPPTEVEPVSRGFRELEEILQGWRCGLQTFSLPHSSTVPNMFAQRVYREPSRSSSAYITLNKLPLAQWCSCFQYMAAGLRRWALLTATIQDETTFYQRRNLAAPPIQGDIPSLCDAESFLVSLSTCGATRWGDFRILE